MKKILLSSIVLVAVATPAVSLAAAYPEISCSTLKAFESNNCDQCFDGGTIKTGDTLGRLTDTWTNKGTGDQIAYKDEQQWPTVVNIGGNGTKWNMSPTDPEKFWKYGSSVIWTKASGSDSSSGSTARDRFVLGSGKTVTFIESDSLGATYTLVSTDKSNGEVIGMAKFPVVYRELDSFAKESAPQTHYECVAYKAPTVAAPTPKPTPTQPNTNVKTGPGEMILAIVALLGGLMALVALKRKKSG